MCSASPNSDTDPDALSGFFLVLGEATVSGHRSGHRVRILPEPPICWVEMEGVQPSSRHISRQNGERGEPESRNSGYPAVIPAILRDFPANRARNGKSCHFSCQSGRRPDAGWLPATRQAQKPADVSGAARRAKTEARETDKALKDILEKIGV